MIKGFFIAFEGPDGSGKSTQVELLSKHLIQDGHPCIITEEPGGTDEGRILRDIILNPKMEISKKTELFLFLAEHHLRTDQYLPKILEYLEDRVAEIIREEDRELFARALESRLDR